MRIFFMHTAARSIFSVVLCFLLFSQSGIAQTASPESTPKPKQLKINRGAQLKFVLSEPVSSATAKKGQTVRMELREPWIVGDRVILPKGAPATGIVSKVKRPVPGNRIGRVVITKGTIQISSGQTIPLEVYMPDREECDDAQGACIAVYTLYAIITLPLILISLPIALVYGIAHLKKGIVHLKKKPAYPLAPVDSDLPIGSKIEVETRRSFLLQPSDASQ
jgi:hypothetical protein